TTAVPDESVILPCSEPVCAKSGLADVAAANTIAASVPARRHEAVMRVLPCRGGMAWCNSHAIIGDRRVANMGAGPQTHQRSGGRAARCRGGGTVLHFRESRGFQERVESSQSAS